MNNLKKMFYNYTFNESLGEELPQSITSEKDLQTVKYNITKDLASIEDGIEESERKLSKTKVNIKEQLKILEYKILKVAEKVRGAVLSERGTSGAVYTTQIPLNNQQTTENTTAKIEEGVAFGVPRDSESYSPDLTLFKVKDLQIQNLHQFSINKSSEDVLEGFSIHPYAQSSESIEINIILSGQLRTDSYIVLDPTDHILTEVYINGKLYETKKLKRTVVIPVNNKTSSVGLRIYPTLHRTSGITFKKIGFTELIYNEETFLETKNISIDKNLYQIVIDTCDNSSDTNVDIQYYVSLNDEEWEACAPVAKPQALLQQSIITIDKEKTLRLYGVVGEKKAEGDYRFSIPDQIQTNTVLKHRVFLKNVNNIADHELTIICTEDTRLIKEAIILQPLKESLYIDGRLQQDSEIFLTKGVHKIFSKTEERLSHLNIAYLNALIGEDNIYLNVIEKDILIDSETGLKYVSFTKPELINTLKEGEAMTAYFPGVKSKKTVSTLKLKATLKSLDKKTVPYISRILVRGA